jgi:DNA-binding NarL/FixJ family response regulator
MGRIADSRKFEGLSVEKSNAPIPQLAAQPGDRLFDLLSSFSRLRNNNRALVSQIRGSLGELREIRNRLRSQPLSPSALPRTGALDAEALEKRFRLTPREIEVATLLARGRSNQAIARELNISTHTARHHTQRILSKLGVHSRGEAAAVIRG